MDRLFLSCLAGLQAQAAPLALTLQSASEGWLKGLSIEQLLDILAGRGPAHGSGTVCDTCGRLELEVRLSYCALPRQRMLGKPASRSPPGRRTRRSQIRPQGHLGSTGRGSARILAISPCVRPAPGQAILKTRRLSSLLLTPP